MNNPDSLLVFKSSYTLEITNNSPGHLTVLRPELHFEGRCDTATRGGFSGSACVFGNVIPRWNINRNDPQVLEAAQHIWDAQRYPDTTKPEDPEGDPKVIPSLLERTTDSLLNKANRDKARAACRQYFGENPDGEDCDEYPMASTYQGTVEAGTNFSVRRINPQQNQLAGSWLSSWYTADRILEMDQFYVVVYDEPA